MNQDHSEISETQFSENQERNNTSKSKTKISNAGRESIA